MSDKINIDNLKSIATEKADTWAAAVTDATGGHVKFGVSDLHPDRIERLGQYLSDTSNNALNNPDVAADLFTDALAAAGNTFGISPPGVPQNKYTDLLFDIIGEVDLNDLAGFDFKMLGKGTSFTPESLANAIKDSGVDKQIIKLLPPDIQAAIATGKEIYTKGLDHVLLSLVGPKLVQAQMDAAKLDPTSRWAGIGMDKFPFKEELESVLPRKYSPIGLNPSAIDNYYGELAKDPTAGTLHKRYVHPNLMRQIDLYTTGIGPNTISNVTAMVGVEDTDAGNWWWPSYLELQSLVGQKITVDAMKDTKSLMLDPETGDYTFAEPTIEQVNTYAGYVFTGTSGGNPVKNSKETIEEIKALRKEAGEDTRPRSVSEIRKGLKGKTIHGVLNSWVKPFVGVQWKPFRIQNPGPKENLDLQDTDLLPKLTKDDWGKKYGPQKIYDARLKKKRSYERINPNTVLDFPTVRMANTHKLANSRKFRTSTTETPSLMLLPKSIQTIKNRLVEYGVEAPKEENGRFAVSGFNSLWKGTKEDQKADGISSRHQATTRFTPDQVRAIEDQLEAEYMPFYIQDLRTNEIISFHAFLESIEDSYSAEWSAQKGFGRLEAAQIYGGGSRSIGVSFTIIPTDDADFDDMWVKINKLTTLVYPQWSEGTLMQTGQNKFIQPFSQVPTASPLCRLRVGDLFTSNYSKTNMARMMGIANANFTYDSSATVDHAKNSEKQKQQEELDKAKSGRRYIKRSFLIYNHIQPMRSFYAEEGYKIEDITAIYDAYDNDPTAFEAFYFDDDTISYKLVDPKDPGVEWYEPSSLEDFINNTELFPEESTSPGLTAEQALGSEGIGSLFSSENPIIKSFESTMGRGIAVAINSIGLDWKLNSVPWNMNPGHRAPRQCTVSLGVIPIHDITPGIDHEGYNRAPIYTVGNSMTSVGGDPWYNNKEYNELVNNIEVRHLGALHPTQTSKPGEEE